MNHEERVGGRLLLPRLLRLRLLLELAVAIVVIWYVYSVTGDTVQIVWVACFVLMVSLGGDTFYFVRRLREKEARLRLEKFEMLPEYQDEANDLRTILGVMTALVAAFTYFDYTARVSDPVIWGTLSIFLFASLWVTIEWSWFLEYLQSLRRYVNRSYLMALFVLAVSFVVTALISAEIAKVMKVPFLFDTIAIFTPLIVLSIFERQLAEQLTLLVRIKSPSDSLDELEKRVIQIGQGTRTKQTSVELRQMRQMRRKLETSLMKIEQIRASVRSALEAKMQIAITIRDQAKMYESLRSRSVEKPPLVVLCDGRLYVSENTRARGQVRRVYDLETGLDIDDKVLKESVIRTTVLITAFSSSVTVMKAKLALRRFFNLARDVIVDLLTKSIDELFAEDLSIWISTEDSEVRGKKAASIDLHMTAWPTIYLSRRRALLEETVGRLAISFGRYPACELVSVYLAELRQLIDCQHDEERSWLARVEACRAFENANPGSTTFLSGSGQRALDHIRKDLGGTESQYRNMLSKLGESADPA
jgi:hypothetical protein